MFRIKVRVNGKWTVVDKFDIPEDAPLSEKWVVLDTYNRWPTPRMLIGDSGIIHKQYSDNGFIYTGRK